MCSTYTSGCICYTHPGIFVRRAILIWYASPFGFFLDKVSYNCYTNSVVFVKHSQLYLLQTASYICYKPQQVVFGKNNRF